MKRIGLMLLAGASIFYFSCSNEEKKPEPMPAAADIIVPEASSKVIILEHPVRDFTRWRAGYMEEDSLRQLYGISHYVMGRGLEDSNIVMVVNKITEGQRAKDFSSLPALKEKMIKSGVTAEPRVSYVEMVRNDESPLEQKDVMIIGHKVKDFYAWLKVFDREGKDKRKEYGLIDRAMGRSMNDSSVVYVVFAVADIAKAKERVASDDLKKLMAEAGVEGPPQIAYYRIVQ